MNGNNMKYDDEFFEVPVLTTPKDDGDGKSRRPRCPVGGYLAFYIQNEERCVVATTNDGKDYLDTTGYAKYLGKAQITTYEDYQGALESFGYIEVRGHEVRRI